MNVESAKVGAKFFLLLNTNVFEILASEDDNATLSDEQRKLILLHVGQLGELETLDFSPHTRREFGNFDFAIFGIEQVGFGFICLGSTVDKLEWLSRGELGSLIVDGEVAVVFVLLRCLESIQWRQVIYLQKCAGMHRKLD
jgi:hypothetical protein